MIDDRTGELFVLYLAPERRNEGIGTKLMDVITQQKRGVWRKRAMGFRSKKLQYGDSLFMKQEVSNSGMKKYPSKILIM